MLCFIVSIQVPTVPPRRGGLHREASATLALLDIPWLVPAGWGTALLRVGHPPVDDAKGGIFKCLSRKCDATRLRPCCGRICSCWGRLDHCLGRHSAICTLVAIQALGSSTRDASTCDSSRKASSTSESNTVPSHVDFGRSRFNHRTAPEMKQGWGF